MTLLAKKILRDPLRCLSLGEANRRVATAMKSAKPETNRNGESTPSFPLPLTNKTNRIKKEQLSILTQLRSHCPEGVYWKMELGQKRKRKTTVRLIESVQMDLPLKIERRDEDEDIRPGLHKRAKTTSPTIDTHTMDGNKAGLGVKSKERSKKQDNGPAMNDTSVTNTIPRKHNARTTWTWDTSASCGAKSTDKPLTVRNPSSDHHPKPAPVAAAKTSIRANVHKEQKKKKKKKKEKKLKKKKSKKMKKEKENVPTMPQQSQKQPATSSHSQEVACSPKENREFFLDATQAAKDFVATEEGARYRTNNDEESPMVLV